MDAEEAILFYCLVKRKNKINKKRKRRLWVHPIIGARMEKGSFHTLFPDLLKFPTKFFNYFRMSSESFLVLYNLIKNDTNIRR